MDTVEKKFSIYCNDQQYDCVLYGERSISCCMDCCPGYSIFRALKGNRKSFIISFFCVLLMIFGQKAVIQCVEHQAGMQLSEGVPAISVVAMGFQDDDPNHTGSGTYNAYQINIFGKIILM